MKKDIYTLKDNDKLVLNGKQLGEVKEKNFQQGKLQAEKEFDNKVKLIDNHWAEEYEDLRKNMNKEFAEWLKGFGGRILLKQRTNEGLADDILDKIKELEEKQK